ncbi:MAG: biotin synthase BioB [Phycisphaera sp.]|nr:biotin synthase BioB [Phycisphaera sp.]
MDGTHTMSSTNARPYRQWTQAGLDDRSIDRTDAADILNGNAIDTLSLVHAAGEVRRGFFGNTVTIHVLDNVRNGACPEDCGYCGQSRDSDAPIQPYKLKSVDAIVDDARRAQESGAYRFCMAISGRGPGEREIEHMCDAISRIKAMGLRTCLSAGLLDDDKARQLRDAGLDRLNHNLNTSRRHYPEICTTHTYDDRVDTLRAAKDAGLGVCSGLIVGMNETYEDLLDVAYALRAVRAESIPVNFLLPIEGNRVNNPTSGGRPLDPQFVLRVLCMMRLVNPTAEIRIAAGREAHLRSLQPLGLYPANSLFMEGYLLTEGQAAGDTLRMILDAGFTPAFDNPAEAPESLRRLIEGHANGSLPHATPTDTAGAPEMRATLKVSVAKKA